MNSKPVLDATSNEYAIAVTTPSHSKTRDLFMAVSGSLPQGS
ncbi:hypothetical protein GM50_11530 [freshwater metagenome]|uniref:Uncharacterized protein n=1 Tax=freshwater metagenome TaxID=449393 RepID=A0A094Q627_9ZZZZ